MFLAHCTVHSPQCFLTPGQTPKPCGVFGIPFGPAGPCIDCFHGETDVEAFEAFEALGSELLAFEGWSPCEAFSSTWM